jgi:hypothetical protein
MPIAPYTWQTDDFLTASRLNAELRQVSGQPFVPNGPGWHASKPVYKSFLQNIPTGWPSGGWTPLALAGQTVPPWSVLADTGFFAGSKSDPNGVGQMSGESLINGGGAVGQPGGLALITSNVAWSGGSAGSLIKSGTGIWNGASPTSQGTVQAGDATYDVGTYAVDIVDFGANGVSGFAQSAGPNFASIAGTQDGSWVASRIHGMWASVYPANGAALGSLPTPVSSWSSSSALTATLMNSLSGITRPMDFFNMPPLLRVQASTGTSATTGTNTVINYPAATYDTYGAWNSGTDTYTTPLAGLYLVAAFVSCGTMATGNYLRSNLLVGGTNYAGPAAATTGSSTSAGKVQIFNLAAGTTIQHCVQQNVGTITTNSGQYGSYMIVLYLGATQTPSGTTPPDVTYLFQAGTPGSAMPALFNAYLANDLNFLMSRPYLIANQSTAQTGIAAQVSTLLQMNGTISDNYSGWSTSTHKYTAQVDGFYLCVTENFMATPSLTTSPVQCAGFALTPYGLVASDLYQMQSAFLGSGNGAAGIGIYYLRAGDTIAPVVLSNGTSSTTTSSFASSPSQLSHFEAVWISE